MITIKKYTIEITIDTEKQTYHVKRNNDGFHPIELLGILEETQLEIVDEINGRMPKPTIVERTVVEEEHSKPEDKLLKRKDIAKLFDVSLVTVHAWMKSRILPFHRIGSRVFFKKSEVISAMKEVKIRRKL